MEQSAGGLRTYQEDPQKHREVLDSAERIAEDVGVEGQRIASQAAQAASETYGRASQWLQENYGKTLGLVGFLAAVGVVGYFLGRNNRRPELQH